MAPRPRLARLLAPTLRAVYSTPTARLPPLLSQSLHHPSTSSTPSRVSLNGWIRSIRKQKNISFAVISDGTKVDGVQVVLPKGLEKGLTVGCSASLEGEWVESPKQGSGKEFKVQEISWIGESDAETFPIPNTKQGIPLPLLRHNAHLRSRKQDMASMLNIRSEMNWAMTNHFRNEGFIKVEAPIITSSDCEGGGEVFKVIDATPPPPSTIPNQSSSSPLSPATTPSRYLSVSSQLHLEAIASSHPRVYALSPCFRAEKSDTARHLQEFWMLEAELAFLAPEPSEALEQVMQVTEDSVRAIARRVQEMDDFDYLANTKNGNDIGLRKRIEGLLMEEKYPRMTYTEAIKVLQREEETNGSRFKFKPEWGASLQTEHEKYLAEEHVRGPLFVTDYPTPLKPFYMLRNPSSPDEPGPTTACFDLLVPQLGELAGGSLRTHSAETLLETIRENPKMKEEDYDWYLDLRKYGTTRHGGFGLGWERLVGLLTGISNVRECIAFPRAGEGSRF
ncbi:uncharacterized protein JCM6883_000335 [Sporobolomyces salmoneus]|uniref:uncharacterized protein n=1 Tax=Sporobolomyces salmoneus TaxID=183962 RepID=UPI00317C985C